MIVSYGCCSIEKPLDGTTDFDRRREANTKHVEIDARLDQKLQPIIRTLIPNSYVYTYTYTYNDPVILTDIHSQTLR